MDASLSLQIDSFLQTLAVEKGLAQNTVEAYSRDLNGLADFLNRRGVKNWPATHEIDLRLYVAALRKRRLAPRSIARALPMNSPEPGVFISRIFSHRLSLHACIARSRKKRRGV